MFTVVVTPTAYRGLVRFAGATSASAPPAESHCFPGCADQRAAGGTREAGVNHLSRAVVVDPRHQGARLVSPEGGSVGAALAAGVGGGDDHHPVVAGHRGTDTVLVRGGQPQ